jgi:hypothetical protein
MHTAAEELTALAVLDGRIRTGRWPTTDPGVLNRHAASFAPAAVVRHPLTRAVPASVQATDGREVMVGPVWAGQG